MAGNRFLDWSKLSPIVPYTRQHIGRLERAGKFPRRVQLGENRVAWLESEIEAWIAERAAERDQSLRPSFPPDPAGRSDLGGIGQDRLIEDRPGHAANSRGQPETA